MELRKHRKFDLLDKIIQAINDDGWNVLYISDPDYHPFKLKIYKEQVSYNIQVYVWNLTHGGGVQRPIDEYRIQITGVDHFEQDSGWKTLILGWWDEGSVFAGFDYTKHTGQLGFSPSIQIREEALRKAHINGFSAWVKDNQEIAIAFRPDFIVEYIRDLESLHSFGESRGDLEILEDVSERPDEVNETLIETVAQERQSTITNIKKKIRDNSFKSRVLASYGQQCAICGLQLKLIDAAHIIPVEYNGSDHTSNGIAMCAIHHRAFDRSLITINENYQIIYSERKMGNFKEMGLEGGMDRFIRDLRAIIILPPAINDRPHIEYIRHANEIRGWI